MQVLKSGLVLFVLIVSLKSFGQAENCDTGNGVLIYEDIACKPVKTEGKNCPTRYDCDLSQPKSGCRFKGKNYGVGEEIISDLPNSACRTGCRCDGLNSFTCAVVDCPQYSGHVNIDSNCYNTYTLGKCCSTGRICNSTGAKTCEVDSITYQIGQKFYPRNTCLECLCQEDFTGEYDEKTCIKRNCAAEIRFSSELPQNCAPFYLRYHSDHCCPDYFVCPKPSDIIKVINSNADRESNLECSYGEKKVKLGEGFETKINKYGERHVQCECIVPPFLTCKEKL